MSEKLSFEKATGSIAALIEFARDNSNKSTKKVIVKKYDNIIFSENVTVIVGNHNIYYQIDIIWDDVISEDEYHGMGLHGYYSSDYNEITYSQGTLIIDTKEGIVITIV